MAKFTWLVNGRDRRGVQDRREREKKRLQYLSPKPVGMDEDKEGLGALQRSGRPEACSRPRARVAGGGKEWDRRAVTPK